MKPNRLAVAVVALTATVLVAPSQTASAAKCVPGRAPAPQYQDVNRAGQTLATRFERLLQKQDVAGLRAFLSPAFQVQREDGSGMGKQQYLTSLPVVQSFTISAMAATKSGNVIVARYLMDATGLVNSKPYSPGPAPRISTFAWNGCVWQIVAHGNFNTLTPTPAAGSQVLLDKQTTTILGQPVQYPTGPAQVSSSIVTLLPGQETGRHRHDAPMYAYILSGQVTVTYDDGTVKTYTAGSAFMEAIGTYHNGQNTGTVPVRILVVNIGADGVANTVKAL